MTYENSIEKFIEDANVEPFLARIAGDKDDILKNHSHALLMRMGHKIKAIKLSCEKALDRLLSIGVDIK